mmetsp:Transcript_30441/g.47978  ORF Transcript_30441/g.47978 Transcript_30441/m.47978 type:complete len:228 (-) Transcript_30441:442-1125(-)
MHSVVLLLCVVVLFKLKKTKDADGATIIIYIIYVYNTKKRVSSQVPHKYVLYHTYQHIHHYHTLLLSVKCTYNKQLCTLLLRFFPHSQAPPSSALVTPPFAILPPGRRRPSQCPPLLLLLLAPAYLSLFSLGSPVHLRLFPCRHHRSDLVVVAQGLAGGGLLAPGVLRVELVQALDFLEAPAPVAGRAHGVARLLVVLVLGARRLERQGAHPKAALAEEGLIVHLVA